MMTFPPRTRFLALFAGLATAWADTPLPLSESYWQDPAFQKSFNGSYRIQARIEPAVSTEERGLLVAVQELMEKGQRTNALETLTSSDLTAKSAALQFNIGNLHFEKGDTDDAIKAFESALETFPSFRRAHRNLAMALVRKGELEKALPHLIEAMQLGDQDAATFGLLGYCRLQREEWSSALQAYRMAQISQPDAVEWKAGVAQCLQHLEATREAAALLDEVIAARPSEASYAVLQASILLDLDRDEDAVAALELPRRLGTLDAANLMLLADLHLRAERSSDATTIVDEAYALETPPAIDRATSLASTAIYQRDWDFAKGLLTKATPAEGDPPAALRRLEAMILIASDEDPEKGATMLGEIIAQNPIDGSALLALGRYELDQGSSERAELLLTRATAVDATAIEAHIALANLHVRDRRYTPAIEAIEQALALRSDSQLEEYLENLEKLQDAAR